MNRLRTVTGGHRLIANRERAPSEPVNVRPAPAESANLTPLNGGQASARGCEAAYTSRSLSTVTRV